MFQFQFSRSVVSDPMNRSMPPCPSPTPGVHPNPCPLSRWWTGRPGVLLFMGLQRVGHDWATELNWTKLNWKPLTVWTTTNYKIFLMRWEYQTTLSASWETCMQHKKQQFILDMEQWTGSKLGKDYVEAVYYYRVYLTYIQSTSYEMLSWMTHKLESRLKREIETSSDMQMIPL